MNDALNMTIVRDVNLANEMSGTGPTLVWGHGLSSSMAKEDLFGLLDWPTVRHVTNLLRYDARGHGESGSTAEPMDYHWRNLALDQLALADALDIGSYIAGGASMGCAT
ncbi:MAG: alpha/beta hydrolase, partial [Ilumatobacteraceae bacterium]